MHLRHLGTLHTYKEVEMVIRVRFGMQEPNL
jgi:hypothetical protein